MHVQFDVGGHCICNKTIRRVTNSKSNAKQNDVEVGRLRKSLAAIVVLNYLFTNAVLVVETMIKNQSLQSKAAVT
jgi:hypothetical protein